MIGPVYNNRLRVRASRLVAEGRVIPSLVTSSGRDMRFALGVSVPELITDGEDGYLEAVAGIRSTSDITRIWCGDPPAGKARAPGINEFPRSRYLHGPSHQV